MKSPLLWSLLLVGCASECCFAEKALQFTYEGQQKTMLVAGYAKDLILGIERDGRIEQVDPNKVEDPTILPYFRPYTQAHIRGQLLREFGQSYEVSGTGSYLIVHPKGAKDLWAGRFEQLKRSMTHFFRSRGFPMKRCEFPLVGIVFYSESQYLNYCNRVLQQSMAGSYGVYSHKTNRIYLYDATQGVGEKSPLWEENVATIMHEAAHQTAFNTGIHVRYAPAPVWTVEGLGCHFEGRGVYDSFAYKSASDRINVGRLRDFKSHVRDRSEYYFSSMIASDKIFKRDTARAYAAAWALTYYLSERESSNYTRYLREVAKHEALEYGYDDEARIKEFARFFGSDLKMLAVRISRFIDGLKVPGQN